MVPTKHLQILLTVISLGYLLSALWASPLARGQGLPMFATLLAEESGIHADDTVFLPIIVAGFANDGTNNKPLLPDTYPSEGSNPPVVESDPNATECASFIKFTNFSNETIYLFWLGPNNEELLYKVLASGRHYWQHTYRLNEWRVRDDLARPIRTFVAESCENSAVNIFVEDLPPCGGILNIGLWRLDVEEPVPGYANLTTGMTIDLGQLPRLTIRTEAQDAVESIEVLGGGAVVALNEPPYEYPPNGVAWEPAAGTYTLVFNAYRKDNATGNVCDSRELTLTVLREPTATVTPSPTLTLPPNTVTSTPSATPTLLPHTATPTLTPPPTSATPRCTGEIESIQLLDLRTEQSIPAYAPLVNDAVVVLDTLPATFNIDAKISGAIEILIYSINGDQSLENRAPYRYPGGDVNPWQPTAGTYTLTATALALNNSEGAICDQQTIRFTVVESMTTSTLTPTMTPTALPTMTPTATIEGTPTATPTVEGAPTTTSTPTMTAMMTPTPTPTLTPTPTSTETDTCIGNRTWIDTNADGIQQENELGALELDIYLWADKNFDGLPDRVIATTTTDDNGFYQFCTLDAALTYIVEFGNDPLCRFTLDDQGLVEDIDSDANPLNGLTAPIRLGTNEVNDTIDAGYVCPVE